MSEKEKWYRRHEGDGWADSTSERDVNGESEESGLHIRSSETKF